MATEPRVPSAVAGQPANFGTVMGHAPDIIGSFFALYAEFWQRGIVADDLKEMTRVRNARVTDCGY
jgi:hypothetical protein